MTLHVYLSSYNRNKPISGQHGGHGPKSYYTQKIIIQKSFPAVEQKKPNDLVPGRGVGKYYRIHALGNLWFKT